MEPVGKRSLDLVVEYLPFFLLSEAVREWVRANKY